MTRDIDEILEGLRADAAEPRLADMDDAVLAGVAQRRERSAGRRTLMLTSTAALVMGLFGSLSVPQDAQAVSSLALGSMPAAAPSRLLLGAP